jgi:hypothetical protein
VSLSNGLRQSNGLSRSNGQQSAELAKGLGWFSLGLGVAQLAAPDAVNRLIGVQPTEANRDLMRAIGVRELIAGVGILTSDEPSGYLWARVAGDAMDLGLLATALSANSDKGRTALATAAVAGVTALDVLAAAGRSPLPAPLAA